jgi:hypothetical protein
MSKRPLLAALVVFLLLGTIIAAVAMSQPNNQTGPVETPAITPTPSANGPDLSPTPALEATPSPSLNLTVSGEVVSISEQPVGFMNARIIRVQEPGGQTLVYVTTDTRIIGPNGQLITLNSINQGDQVQAQGQPTEGGILATEIVIQTTPTP